jgi:cell division topological specificity factor
VFNFFNRKKSKDALKDRLKLVLSYDRAGLAPGQMDALKRELLQVIQKYFPAAENEYDVKLEQQGNRMVFVANLPVQKD